MTLQNSTYDWKYYSEPCKTASLGLNSGTYWPRGKMLGGSSAMNALLYVRGNKRDYDRWQMAGNPTWGWNDVLPFFKKSEKNHLKSLNKNFHGYAGLQHINAYTKFTGDERMKELLMKCFNELGFKEINDINADTFLGFVKSQGTLDNGARHSAAKAFLHRNLIGDRKNLHIIKLAHVTKLIFDKDTRTVTGVEFKRDHHPTNILARARKEVILSAGTINTPQILLHSGIGSADQMKQNEIPLILNLPGVGENLQDHMIVPYILSFHKSSAQPLTIRDLSEAYYQFAINRNGTLTNLGSTDYLGFISTVNDTNYPDIQLLNFMFSKQLTAPLTNLLQLFNYKEKIIDSIVAANTEAETLLIFVALLNPKSRGKIELRNADPFSAPRIFTNYLQEQADIDTVLRALNILRKLPTTNAFKRYEGDVVRVNIEGCDQIKFDSNDYWECYVRHLSITLYHPVGTAKMGRDKDAVVDATLKVRGINGLRVADASIMPNIVSANTHAATMMIGEKAADFINQKWLIKSTIVPKAEL